MLKLEIRLDRGRIIENGEYDPDKLQEKLDKGFLQFGFRKELLGDGTVCYWGNNLLCCKTQECLNLSIKGAFFMVVAENI